MLYPSYHNSSKVVNFNQLEFKIAFAVEDYSSRTGLDDPNYVYWSAKIKKSVNNTVTTT